MTVVEFYVGPSVPAREFAAACQAVAAHAELRVLPPIQQGDLVRRRVPAADVVGIIDGFFFQVPALSHKEVLLTLERGVRVLGASSLGALRAAELDRYGMEGVGEVYRLYRRGVIDADDEVAVAHTDADEGFRPLTVPLVDIRHNLRRAFRRGVMQKATATAALTAARRLHFTERTYAAVLAAVVDVVADADIGELRDFLAQEAVDVKRQDALALVALVADRVAGRSAWPRVDPPRTNRTVYLHLFERAYAGEADVPDALVLSLHRVLSPTFPELVRRAWPVGDGPQFMVPGIPWEAPLLREMELAGEFGPAQAVAREVLRKSALLDEEVPGLARAWSTERLEAWLARRWGVGPEQFEAAMWERAVCDYRELIQSARLAYAAERRGGASGIRPPPPPAAAAP